MAVGSASRLLWAEGGERLMRVSWATITRQSRRFLEETTGEQCKRTIGILR